MKLYDRDCVYVYQNLADITIPSDFTTSSHDILGTDHLTWRVGYGFFFRSELFYLDNTRVRIYFFCHDGFFLKKYSDSQCCWKKYSDFGGGKKNNVIQSFYHIT
jgi:hypothetical protein